MIGDTRRFRFSCVKASWAAIVRGAGHVALAAIRATTHVDGKVTLSSQLRIEVASRGADSASASLLRRRSDPGADRASPDACISSLAGVRSAAAETTAFRRNQPVIDERSQLSAIASTSQCGARSRRQRWGRSAGSATTTPTTDAATTCEGADEL